MNLFDELHEYHQSLLTREQADEDVLETAQDFIRRIRFESEHISSTREREQLRAIMRYWSAYVFERTQIYPNTEMRPSFIGQESEVPLEAGSGLRVKFVVAALATVVLILLISSPFLFELTDVDDPMATPTQAILTPLPTPLPTPTTAFLLPIENLEILSEITADNAEDLQPIASLTGHGSVVLHVTFTADGRHLVSSGADGRVRIWTLDNLDKSPIVVDIDQTGWTQAAIVSNNGSWLAAGGNDRVVKIINLDNPTQTFAQFVGHEGFVFGLDFHPDNIRLASGSGDGTLKVWNIESGNQLVSALLSESAILELDFSPDGSLLAVANFHGGFRLLTFPSLQAQCLISDEIVLTTSFSPEGNFVILGTANGDLIRLDPVSCRRQETIQAHSDNINGIAQGPDGEVLVSGSRDGTAYVMPGEVRLTTHTDSVESIAMNPAGTLIASASADGTIIIWGVLGD